MESNTVPSAVFTLQSASSSLDDRVGALRFLKQYINSQETVISSYDRNRITQLILDNTLRIILMEERISNMTKRQMIRTELFLIVANLMNSSILFNGVLSNPSGNGQLNATKEHQVRRQNPRIIGSSLPIEYDPSYTDNEDRVGAFEEYEIDCQKQELSSPSRIKFATESSHRGLVSKAKPKKPFHHPPMLIPPGGWVKEKDSVVTSGTSSGKVVNKLSLSSKNVLKSSKSMELVRVSSPALGGTASRTTRLDANPYPLLHPIIAKHTHSILRKSIKNRIWQPRPSVLYGNQLATDSFAIGVDPHNYFEQDRRLGYQKPRMWFPGMEVGLQPSMMPDSSVVGSGTTGDNSTEGSAQQRVKEYLQMRALASYVGDLVLPFSPNAPGSSYLSRPSNSNSDLSGVSYNISSDGSSTSVKSRSITRLAGCTDPRRFDAAINEVSSVWSPLLGLHLRGAVAGGPMGQNTSVVSVLSARRNNKGDGGVPGQLTRPSTAVASTAPSSALSSGRRLPPPPAAPSHRSALKSGGSVLSNKRAIEQDIYGEIMPFKLLRTGPVKQSPTAAFDSDISSPGKKKRGVDFKPNLPPSVLVRSIGSDQGNGGDAGTAEAVAESRRYHLAVKEYLETQKHNISESIRASEAIIDATIKAGYKMLQPNYLLILEGNKAKSRRLITKMLMIFCRVKRENWLSLAFGTWAIGLVDKESAARRPHYARIAACHLMARWLQEVYLKKLRVWVARWNRRAAVLIFLERSKYAIIIQRLYRTWRDRRKFLDMHQVGPWHGILSDVHLGAKRPYLRFFIPDDIRIERRLLWLAATMIQTVYRCWIGSREYFQKRRHIVTIQSICRMWPKFRKYKRLKRVTISCQAWMRRTVKRRWYMRLRYATIIVQMYVRRYLRQLQKDRTLKGIWKSMEARMAAAIQIQCRWRIHVAKSVLADRKLFVQMQQWAALVVQRNYYRYKKAFHTFFLMCALRQRQVEDIKLEKLATTMGRYKAARLIQRHYKVRFFKRIITSIIKVQCWFRGRMGYNLVDCLRRERWAERKLRHWAGVRVRRWHRLARTIQKWWWRRRKERKRLMRHLWGVARLRDLEEDRLIDELHYRAALRIQAVVKGIWDRRWVRKHRAVLIIQKNAKFFFALKRWRRWKKEKIRKQVSKFVVKFLDRAVRDRATVLVRHHIQMLHKPQACIRGAVVRMKMYRTRVFAYRLGMAVVRIQRFWRSSGAIAKAVGEVLALKRMQSNPFLKCECFHDALVLMKKQNWAYYSNEDPRVGLKVAGLLYRLGCLELIDMFPRKHYVYATDLSSISKDKMVEMYTQWKQRVDRVKQAAGTQSEGESVKNRRNRVIPTQLLDTIIDIVSPPIGTRDPQHLEKFQKVFAMPEKLSPARASDIIRKTYLKKFGKHLVARAEHLSRDVLEMVWTKYSNYKAIGPNAITTAQIVKAISITQESTQVMQNLEELRRLSTSSSSTGINSAHGSAILLDEQKWDRDRVHVCAQNQQLVIDRAATLLPPGFILDQIQKASYRATTYQRKIAFLRNKFNINNKNNSSDERTGDNEHVASTEESTAISPIVAALFEEDNINQKLSINDSLEIPFTGKLDDLDLEYDLSIIKIYSDVLDKLYIGSCGVQSLKNIWRNNTMKRMVAKEKMSQFLTAVTQDYRRSFHEDKVKMTWNKFKRKEAIKHKLELIMKAVHEKKEKVGFELSFVPRYGWETYNDEYGYPYWIERTRQEVYGESSYDMPTYSFEQWRMLQRMQRMARVYISAVTEKKRLKEEQQREELARLEALMEKERLSGLRPLNVKTTLKSFQLHMKPHHFTPVHTSHQQHHVPMRLSSSGTGADEVGASVLQLRSEQESLLPWRLRFEDQPVFVTGTWALLRTYHSKHQTLHNKVNIEVDAGIDYDIVVVFRVREQDQRCDARNVQGYHYKNIKISRLCQMNLDIGAQVETRYKRHKLFYRSEITKVSVATIGGKYKYSVRYEDGETAVGIGRDTIRPSLHTLTEFLRERSANSRRIHQQHKRMKHYARLKFQRVHDLTQSAAAASMKYSEARSQEVLPIENGEENDATRSDDLNASALVVISDEMRHNDLVKIESPNLNRRLSSMILGSRGDENMKCDNTFTVASRFVQESQSQPLFRTEVLVHIWYSRNVMRYGWYKVKDPHSNSIYYADQISQQVSDSLPMYDATDSLMIQKIQLAWYRYKARREMCRKVSAYHIPSIIDEGVRKANKFGFIGYQLEGVTPMQILRRGGYWDLADTIEANCRALKIPLGKLSIEDIANKPKDNYEDLGVTQTPHVRDLRDFQNWWRKASVVEKQKKLALINFYSGPYDPRSILECITASEEILVKKFMRVIKTGATRTRSSVQAVLDGTSFPLSHLQVDHYLKKYADKPELARDCVFELINKHTTHTWIEEREVLHQYQLTSQLLGSILSYWKLKKLRSQVAAAQQAALAMLKTIPQVTDSARSMTSGPEAKAAWILRQDVLKKLSSFYSSAVIIQRNVRSYLLTKKWKYYLSSRVNAIALLQLCARRYLAYRVAAYLRAQRASDWEQLWDSRRGLLYYYHYPSGYSTYEEPDEPYRPLVRNPLSAQLMQAWPDLESYGSEGAAPPSLSSQAALAIEGTTTLSAHALCGICNTRKCVRVCKHCVDEVNNDPHKNYSFPYCYVCYMREHSKDNNAKADHEFDIVEAVAAPTDPETTENIVLKCCICGELATRKCMGLLDESQIDDIMNNLKRSRPEKWIEVLVAANVGGERKLTLQMEQLQQDAQNRFKHLQQQMIARNIPTNVVSAAGSPQLDDIRTILERTRAECDDNYCQTCYVQVHSGGKRALHKWKGFQAGAPVCSVCTNTAAESTCFDCECRYCTSCFKVFHGMGRKRRHRKEKILEPLEEGQEICQICQRRAGTIVCNTEKCEVVACDSCYEFKHRPQCEKQDIMSVSKKVAAAAESAAQTAAKSALPSLGMLDAGDGVCVVCSEPADKRCTQCQDLYCSRVWMGNTGCFLQHHSKGNRASHTTERYIYRKIMTRRQSSRFVASLAANDDT